jgi:hypothetical protein
MQQAIPLLLIQLLVCATEGGISVDPTAGRNNLVENNNIIIARRNDGKLITEDKRGRATFELILAKLPEAMERRQK